MENLSLQNFTSIFEILFAYHVGIAFSKDFRNFLGINRRIKNLISRHNEFESLSRIHFSKARYEMLFDEKQRQYLNDRFLVLRQKTTALFQNNGLEKFLRPFYIYFGVLSMLYLFFAGALTAAQDYMHLMFLNAISFLIATCCLINSFRIQKINWKSGEMRIFFGSLLLIITILLTPKSLLEYFSVSFTKINFLNYIKINGFENIQILAAVCLVFTPVIIEIIQIFICLYQLRRVRNDYNTFASTVLPVLLNDLNQIGQTFDESIANSLKLISGNKHVD